MFSKSHRFHGYGSLKGVYARGTTVRGSLINLKFSNRGANKPYRIAVVVSKKVSKFAVKRNRIRRRVYEQVRLAGETISPGTDLVFTIFSDKVAEIETEQLHSQVKELLQKAK